MESEYSTGELAAMRVMEMDWLWSPEKVWPSGTYMEKAEAKAIADYCKRFGKWPPIILSKDQRRTVRKNYGPIDVQYVRPT